MKALVSPKYSTEEESDALNRADMISRWSRLCMMRFMFSSSLSLTSLDAADPSPRAWFLPHEADCTA